MAENQHPSIILCPYCGHIQQFSEQKCEACGGFFDRLSLKATQVAMGPWFIHNAKKPFKPGCSYDVIKKQAAAGRIHSRTIMRGPTTRQFWSFAKNVPGVGHLIGYCHNCGQHVTPTDPKCSKCNAPFREVALRNEMGLLYPTIQDANKAQEQLDKETGAAATKQASGSHPAPAAAAAAPTADTAHKAAPGDDLLDEVIGRVEKQTGGKAAPRTAAPAAKAAPASGPAKSAAPAPAPTPAPAGVELGEIDDEETQTPQPAPKSRTNILNILLLVLGIILVIAIQVYMLLNLTPAAPTTGQNQGGQQQNATPTPTDTDTSVTPPAKPTKPVAPARPADPEGKPIATPPSSSTSTTTTPPPPNTEKKPEKKPETLQERYQEALDLEKQKKFKEALAILTDVQNKTPLNQIPKEMVDATRRIQAKVAQQSSAPLFEPP